MLSLAGTFFNIESADITAILGYASNLFTDALPILKVLIGVAVGLMVIFAIASIIRGH